LHQIVSSKFEQPTFGANKLALEISPSAEGGLARGTTAEIKLNGQPLLPFVSVLEKTRERAIEARASREEEEGPRM
jgi:WW domain-binding protein 2